MIFNKLLSFYCPLGINGGIFFFPGKSRWKRRSFFPYNAFGKFENGAGNIGPIVGV